MRCRSDWRIKLDCTDCTNKFKAGDLSFAHVLHLAECLGYELERRLQTISIDRSLPKRSAYVGGMESKQAVDAEKLVLESAYLWFCKTLGKALFDKRKS